MLNPYIIGGVALAFAAALGFGGIQTVRLNHAKADLVEVRAALKTAEAKTKASEAARANEAETATNSFNAFSEACQAGLKAAVTRGRTIERIVSTPARPDGSRGLVGARELRDVAGQPDRP